MAKSIVSKKSAPATPETPKATPNMFRLRIPADRPGLDPDPTTHLDLVVGNLMDQINNLETVEELASIDEENNTVRAMSCGITAALENLREVHENLTKIIELIESAKVEKGGAA